MDGIIADSYGDPYIVLPVDGAKIGICKSDDIWDSLSYKNLWANDINDEIYRIVRTYFMKVEMKKIPDIETNFKVFKKVVSEMTIDKLKSSDDVKWDRRNIIYSDFVDSNYKNLYEFLVKEVFDPRKSGFKVQNIKNFSIKGENEVWIDTDCALLSTYHLNEYDVDDLLKESQVKEL